MRYALILAAATVAVGASVLGLLWVRDRLIDRWCEGFHYGLSDVTPADFDRPEPLPQRNGGRRFPRHQCESWQLLESAQGGFYCGACGEQQ